MPLRLTTVALPGHDATAQVHATPGDAAWHLSNHVLVEPECFAWGYVLPGWKYLLDQGTSTERHNERTRLAHAGGESGQDLYDAYAAALAQDAADAARLRWWAAWNPPAAAAPLVAKKKPKKRKEARSDGVPRPPRPVVVAMGLRAILMVFEKDPGGWVLRTAFVPGQGDAREIAQAGREHRPRANTPAPRPRGHRPEEAAALDDAWTDDQWYFFRVFRPALKFVRRQKDDIRGANDEQLGRHYGLLDPRIPPELRSCTDDVWINFRLTMRGPSAKTG